jgi:uncharacterized membrane protein
MQSEHRPGLFPEKKFRWRAGEITRLEAFCDVVFGFALTLLVISLEVPHSYTALIEDLRGFLLFALCFLQLVTIWRIHYIYSRRYGLEDPYAVFLNMVLLLLVLFYVYPLKFVFTLAYSVWIRGNAGPEMNLRQGTVLMQLYSAGFASVFLVFMMMFAHAYRLRVPLQMNAIEVRKTRLAIQQCAMLVGLGIASAILAFKSPIWARLLYALFGLLAGIPGIIANRRNRQVPS